MMGIKIKIFAIILGLVFTFIAVRFIKKSTIRPSSILLWLMVCLFLFSVPIFEGFYVFIAHDVFGFDNAANIIYIGIMGFVLVYILYLTLQMNKLSDRIHLILSHSAILEKEIKELKARTSPIRKPGKKRK